MEVVGTIKLIKDEQIISPSFKKREMVVTTDEQYPQQILVEFVQDRTNLLDEYKVGEAVKVSVNLRGREWINPQGEARYFISLHGWRIERLGTTPPPTTGGTTEMPSTPVPTELKGEDDLPF